MASMYAGVEFPLPGLGLDANPMVSDMILCQKVTKTFDKSTAGKIYEEELKDIYSLMVLQLDLEQAVPAKKLFLTKSYSFTFSVETALELLTNLDFNVDTASNTVNLSYKLSKSVGVTSLMKFFEAKLIHCPGDRTAARLKSDSILQPTPKGVSIINRFICKHGIKFTTVPQLLLSPLNSNNVFFFERNYLNDKVVYSSYLVQILFCKMFGKRPNIWSSDNKPETFRIKLDLTMLEGLPGQNTSGPLDVFPVDKDKSYTSPLHHKYFTNPESDSHVQYFVEGTGVRVFRNKIFVIDKDSLTVDYCVSGKSVVQWLMDCTDILSKKAAIEIGNIFVSSGVLEPILQPKSKSAFDPSFESFYKISAAAKKKLFWNKRVSTDQDKKILPVKVNTIETVSMFDSLKLKDILVDPGLRYLFKLHLMKEYCFENMDAYDQLHLFHKKVGLLTKLLNYIDLNFDDSHVYKSQVLKLANDCLLLIYHIYFTYLSPQASFVLNIDYSLRSRFIALVVSQEKDLGSGYDLHNNLHSALTYGTYDKYSAMCAEKRETYPGETEYPTGYSETDAELQGTSHSHCTTVSTDETASVSGSTKMTAATPTSTTGSEPNLVANLITNDRLTNTIIGTQVLNDCESVFSSTISKKERFHCSAPTSPRDKEFKEAYNSLIKFTPVATELINSLFKLMEIDSFPKFLQSEVLGVHRVVLEN